MPSVTTILLGVALPLVAAFVSFVAVAKLSRRDSAAWTAGVLVGANAGFGGLSGQLSGGVEALRRIAFPVEATDWMAWLAVLAAVPAALAHVTGNRRGVEWTLTAALAAATPLRLFWGGKYLPSAAVRASGFAEQAWSPTAAAAICAATAAIVWAVAAFWRRQQSSEAPVLRGALLALAAAAAALVAALTGSFRYGQLFGALAAALGGCATAARVCKSAAGAESAATPIAILWASLLMLDCGYSEMRLWQAAFLAAAAILAVGPLPRGSRVLRFTAVALLLAIPVVAAALAFRAAIQQSTATPPW